MFMQKVKTNVLGIFGECLLFLNKEIGVLGHTFIYILRFSLIHTGCSFIGDDTASGEMRILKVLICFFEIEELALNVEGGHEMRYITQSDLNI